MGFGHSVIRWIWGLLCLFVLSLTSCQNTTPPAPIETGQSILGSQPQASAPTQTQSLPTKIEPYQTPTIETSNPIAVSPVSAASPTPTPFFYEPAGCWQPPDDYSRLDINNKILNMRTYAMLQQAALIYGGEIDVSGVAIIQGSYNPAASDSLGTHLGGGAVDIALTHPQSSSVLYTEIEPLIRALRTAGFAAWLRADDGIEPGLGTHIHALAIGDQELSPDAIEQLIGPAGYFRGFDGLPVTGSEPGVDIYGGPLLCRWMLAAGYTDMRSPSLLRSPAIAWQESLRLAAMSYEAKYPEDAEEVARGLDFLEGPGESAENVCGPLAAAILRDAGLLPVQPGPVQDLLSYWQARPSTNGRPWSLFPERDYEVFRFDTPLAEFDFIAWPLQPADFVYTYAKDSGFEHMFIVTEVDAQGRAYTVTNQFQSWGNQIWGNMLILRYLLYDPHTPGAGIIYNEWSDSHLGRTGHGGFEVLRKRGLLAGSLYEYTVRPGDTLPDLAIQFGASLDSIVQANPGMDVANLHIDQVITIPIPPYSTESADQVQGTVP